ncbi:hypothetical protein AMTR_s00060p00207530 [Amborella trichopoda]|uniref:Uncharacterized protein n=1 Tax=Amborella trichopoda TaxID=13333 RepID=W1NKF2_AMBTC|nr:hypothetical protein AMTR_s00060p00207530 [Amborella trichopoda]
MDGVDQRLHDCSTMGPPFLNHDSNSLRVVGGDADKSDGNHAKLVEGKDNILESEPLCLVVGFPINQVDPLPIIPVDPDDNMEPLEDLDLDNVVPIEALVEDSLLMNKMEQEDYFDAQGALMEVDDQVPLNIQPEMELPLLFSFVEDANQNVKEEEKEEEIKVTKMLSDMEVDFQGPLGVVFNELKEKKKARKLVEESKAKAPVDGAMSQKTLVNNGRKAKVKGASKPTSSSARIA